MKVKTLLKKLQKCDPEAEIFLWHDDEGNGFDGVVGFEVFKGKDAKAYGKTGFVVLRKTDEPVLW